MAPIVKLFALRSRVRRWLKLNPTDTDLIAHIYERLNVNFNHPWSLCMRYNIVLHINKKDLQLS